METSHEFWLTMAENIMNDPRISSSIKPEEHAVIQNKFAIICKKQVAMALADSLGFFKKGKIEQIILGRNFDEPLVDFIKTKVSEKSFQKVYSKVKTEIITDMVKTFTKKG